MQLFQGFSVDGRMALEEFAPVAKMLLLMIYQNAYPDVVRTDTVYSEIWLIYVTLLEVYAAIHLCPLVMWL